MLTVLDHIPAGLLDLDACELHNILSGPTLIHCQGKIKQPLFISVLLHGDEYSGWQAVRELLRQSSNLLPRCLSLFIGNVAAAKNNLRHLPEQPDYNRIWKAQGSAAEYTMVRQVLEEMRTCEVFAAIDVHNNSGFNPHYACINRTQQEYKYFATQFSPTVVYFQQPDTVLAIAFAKLCPTVTIECGQAGDIQGIQHVLEFLENTLTMKNFPQQYEDIDNIPILQTVAIVKIPHDVDISFDGSDCQLQFIADMDRYNFTMLAKDALFATIGTTGQGRLIVVDDLGKDVTQQYFYEKDTAIYTRQSIMPAMLTRDVNIIRSDCLCYLMVELNEGL